MSFLICHYVILSYKNHQFISVTLLFCLQINICLSQSLCYSVFKKTSVSLCHYVIMSSKKHLFLSVTLLFCLQKKHLSPSVTLLFCLQKNICLPPSSCYSVFKKTSVSLRHSVILSSKKTSVSLCHYVILSYKNHQFLSVTLLFCLQKNICLPLSLCHYVFKKTSVSLRPSVILSKNAPVGDGSGPSCC